MVRADDQHTRFPWRDRHDLYAPSIGSTQWGKAESVRYEGSNVG